MGKSLAGHLSAIVLTHNAEKTIKDIIKQLDKAADEIIIVDDNSADRTIEIAKNTSKKVKAIRHRLTNHGEQRNIGYAQASGEWLAWVDDDEVWSNELVEEVRRLKGQNGHGYDGFEFLFKTPVLGNVVEDEWHLRLFKAGKGRNTPAFHTTIEMEPGAKIKKIRKGHVLHLPWQGVEPWLKKHIFYSKMDVESYTERGIDTNPWKMLAMFFFVFLKRLRLARFGIAGIVWAFAASTSWLFKACYLVELRRQKREKKMYKH